MSASRTLRRSVESVRERQLTLEGVALPQIEELLHEDTIELAAEFSAKAPTKTRPNPGLVMAIPTEPVDNQAEFQTQIDALEDGVAVAAELRQK